MGSIRGNTVLKQKTRMVNKTLYWLAAIQW